METKTMDISISSTSVIFTTVNNAICVHSRLAEILVVTVYKCLCSSTTRQLLTLLLFILKN